MTQHDVENKTYETLVEALAAARKIHEDTGVFAAVVESKPTKVLPPDPDKGNRNRAMRANACLDLYRSITGSDKQDCVADFLTDLMHCVDRSELEFETELARARRNYLNETGGET